MYVSYIYARATRVINTCNYHNVLQGLDLRSTRAGVIDELQAVRDDLTRTSLHHGAAELTMYECAFKWPLRVQL